MTFRERPTHPSPEDAVEQMLVSSARLTTIRRLELAFQACQFALEVVRLTEQRAHPDLSPEALNWRITQQMQGDPRLGR